MILGIAGHSDTGKTTMVEGLIRELVRRGISVSSIKHVYGEDVLIPPSKDTTRHLLSGSAYVLGASSNESVLYHRGQGTIREHLDLVQGISGSEVVIVEGYKGSDLPKVVLGDAPAEDPVLMRGGDPEEMLDGVVEMVEREVLVERALDLLPGLDCGKCGLPTCREMAEAVVEGEAVIEDCRNLPAGKARITVDGRSLPVGSFVSDVVANTIQGMVRSLKGGEDASRIEISVDLDPEE